jgi:hypothetical protein
LLWEEWGIFNELIRVESLITITEFPDVVKYYDQRRTLLPRASTNFNGLAQVVTPDVISSFWNSIIKALHYFNKGYGSVDDTKDMAMREKCISINHEAWSELKDICTKHGLKLEWPLPRTQAS